MLRASRPVTQQPRNGSDAESLPDRTIKSDQSDSLRTNGEAGRKLFKIVIDNNVTISDDDDGESRTVVNNETTSDVLIDSDRTKGDTKEPDVAIRTPSLNSTTKTLSSSNSSLLVLLNTTTKPFDRPNPDLSGYVMVPSLKQVGHSSILARQSGIVNCLLLLALQHE